MIIVSNTSPLTNLATIGQFDLLQKLYGRVYISTAVWDELNAHGKHWPGRNEVIASSWIVRREAQNLALVTALQSDLDRGEAETIALALELKADLVLLDEREGRRFAQNLGLRVTGVVGLLVAAKAGGFIQEVRPWLDILRERAGFYLSDAVYTTALRMANE